MQPGGPSALTGAFILKLPNQFYRLSCHHKPVLTWTQGRSLLLRWQSHFCTNTCSQLLPLLCSGEAGEQTPRQSQTTEHTPAFFYKEPSHTVWTSESNFHFTQAKPHVPEGPRSPYLNLNSSHCCKVTLKAFGPPNSR